MTDHIPRLNVALEGRYQIERELGAGGMATVYLADDLRHERRVAIKVVRPELSAVLGPERFLAEIRTTANLNHPHILPLFDSGQADDLLYYVMPFVEGESLRERLDRDGAMDVDEALTIARQVAGALDYAHSHGVVHRDVKPENILLGEGGAIVADFGIALAISEAGGDRLTRTGSLLGTPRYMSPEQASGESDATPASDTYALACVVFEMLSGEPPFSGPTTQTILAKVLTAPAPSIRARRPDVSAEADAALTRGLSKRPEDRFSTSGKMLAAMDQGLGSRVDHSRRARVAIVAGALMVLVLGLVSARFYRELSDQRWVRQQAIPEIEELLSEGGFVEAFHLANEAVAVAPDDPTLLRLFEASSTTLSASTDPPGASVRYRGYSASDTTWFKLGATPLEGIDLPDAYLRARVELTGYEPLELALFPIMGLDVQLRPARPGEEPQVAIPAGTWAYTQADPIPIEAFLLDKFEVTNAAFQRFVDAGGYRDPERWSQPFVRDGAVLPWADGVALLVDETGRPGPATWELSRHPEGDENHPVRGVSWYEALAYCEFVGKSLPTYFHWRHAAGLDVFDDVLAYSNFAGEGAWPVGEGSGVGPYGAVDQAGNVKEWTWNSVGGDRRYILGGAWNEPKYQFQDPDARDPFARDATHGFRCASYETPPSADLLAAIEFPEYDFNEVEPVDDATFETIRRFFAYEPGPLEPRIEALDSIGTVLRQTVSFNAAYGGERVLAHVLLPTQAEPPYQAVVYMAGADAFFLDSSDNLAEWHLLSFIPQSGRALVFPIYKGTYERRYNRAPGAIPRREYTVWATQDLNRTLDYIGERADLDETRVGYMGLSYGAEWGIPLAMEQRFAAAALIGGAYDAQWLATAGQLPETSPWNFVPRIYTPTVLINGRYDFQHPYETGQLPFFNDLGAADEDKRLVDLETGHLPPWNDVIRETLDWFDRYLGPVDIPPR